MPNDCSTGEAPTDPGSTTHDECTVGEPLGFKNTCAVEVCMIDPFCCTTTWDQICVDEVGSYCDHACETCQQTSGHDKCQDGGPLDVGCSLCVASICEIVGGLDYCCTSHWDEDCIMAVPAYCEPGYWCPGQCDFPSACPKGQGCPAQTMMCGPCTYDGDCRVELDEVCQDGTCV